MASCESCRPNECHCGLVRRAAPHALATSKRAEEEAMRYYYNRDAEGLRGFVRRIYERATMHHVNSPRSDDAAIEQEIQHKGKTAPRVTPADIEANIAATYYFTAVDGVDGSGLAHMRTQNPAASVEFQPLNDDADPADSALAPLCTLTFCVLVLKNGFTVTGESAPASAANFDAEIGRKIARENAVQKLWPLMGYELKCRLAGSAA